MYKTSFYIPDEMKARRSWVLWRLETVRDRKTKVPYSAVYSGKASTTNPASWSSYADARRVLDNSKGYYNGLGYVLTGDGLVFIDIDHCITAEGLSATAADILHTMGRTFVEISQSGTGLHLFAHGTIPRSFKNSKNGVEMYDGGRYCAITGNAACSDEITDNQQGLDAVFEKYKTADAHNTHTSPFAAIPPSMSDMEIVKKCQEHGDLFNSLYGGDASMYGSRSEADFALCLILAFWTNRDAETIDRIYRTSGLMREKWLRDDYRDRTINRACSQCAESISEYKERKTREGVDWYAKHFQHG